MRASHLHLLGAAVLLLAAAGLAWYGQPLPADKWRFLAAELEPRLAERQVQIEPAELMALMHNNYVDLRLIDVRDERDWNLFHLWGAQRVAMDQLVEQREQFARLPDNGVIVFISNDEARASEAWKLAMAIASRPNAYILAGGINRWLAEFSPAHGGSKVADAGVPDGTLRYPLRWAFGSRHPASLPDPHHEAPSSYRKRVRLQKRVVKKGGCG